MIKYIFSSIIIAVGLLGVSVNASACGFLGLSAQVEAFKPTGHAVPHSPKISKLRPASHPSIHSPHSPKIVKLPKITTHERPSFNPNIQQIPDTVMKSYNFAKGLIAEHVVAPLKALLHWVSAHPILTAFIMLALNEILEVIRRLLIYFRRRL